MWVSTVEIGRDDVRAGKSRWEQGERRGRKNRIITFFVEQGSLCCYLLRLPSCMYKMLRRAKSTPLHNIPSTKRKAVCRQRLPRRSKGHLPPVGCGWTVTFNQKFRLCRFICSVYYITYCSHQSCACVIIPL